MSGRQSEHAFARVARGGFGLPFALGFVPMILLAGLALDYGRTIQRRDNLRLATDAVGAALAREAGGRSLDDIGARARELLAAAPGGENASLSGAPAASADRSKICIDTHASVDTNFIKFMGVPSIFVEANACATRLAGTAPADFIDSASRFAAEIPASMPGAPGLPGSPGGSPSVPWFASLAILKAEAERRGAGGRP